MKYLLVGLLLLFGSQSLVADELIDLLPVSLFDDYIISLQTDEIVFTDDTDYINAIFIGIMIIDHDERIYWYTGASKKLVCKNSLLFEGVLRAIVDEGAENDLVPHFLIRGYGEVLMKCSIAIREHVIARSQYFSKLYDNCLRTHMSHPQCGQMIDIDLKIRDLDLDDVLEADALERHAKKFLKK